MATELDVVEKGSGVRFKATFRDTSGALTDPSDNKATVTVYKPDGTEGQAAAGSTRSSTGIYTYDYTTPAAGPIGTWVVEWNATVDSLTVKARKEFKLVVT